MSSYSDSQIMELRQRAERAEALVARMRAVLDDLLTCSAAFHAARIDWNAPPRYTFDPSAPAEQLERALDRARGVLDDPLDQRAAEEWRALQELGLAVRRWADAGDLKVVHVLECTECERLEQQEDRWCAEASRLGHATLDAANAVRVALAAVERARSG